MNPFERKVIHSALSDNENVKTESQGEEPNRYVVVIPNNLKEDKSERFSKNSKSKKPFDKRERKEKPEVIKLDKKTIGYGTFLGNSQKD